MSTLNVRQKFYRQIGTLLIFSMTNTIANRTVNLSLIP